MDNLIIPDMVGSPSVKDESTVNPEQLNLLEGDPPKLEIFLEKEEPMDEEYEVKDFLAANDSPNQEDPLKISTKKEIKHEALDEDPLKFCAKVEIKQEVYEDDPLKLCTEVEIKKEDFEENPEEKISEDDCSDDFLCVQCKMPCRSEDGVPKNSMDFFCVDCYVTLRMEAYKEWMKSMQSELESCFSCLSSFLNCSDIEKHDCTRENVYYCSECHLMMSSKENMIFHVRQCYEIKEQTIKESEDYLDVSVLDATQHYSGVRNDVCQNEVTSKSIEVTKVKSKKLSAGRNLKSDYKCRHCSKVFKYYSELCRHLPTHSGEKAFVCEYCKKPFTRLIGLKRHMQTHTGEKLFVCKLCSKSFALKGHLKRHMSTHTGEKPFVCEHCKKSFARMSCLKRHKITHTGEKPFVCEHCKKSFARMSCLKRHKITHTGEKPFVCEHCKKSCSQLSGLARHIQTHTGEKPFVCEYCKKSFVRLSTLKLHIRRRHR